ncbi:hypothetical protein H8R17_18175 [Streptomyces sp. TRM68367]|nr:hypothetical protein [Streptomyces sp. TRM68367]
MAAVAAVLAGAFALTACSDGGDSGGNAADTPSPSPSASADTGGGTGGSGGSGGSASGDSDGLQGSWLATTGGKAVALVITGRKAGLFATGGTVCSGSADKESGTQQVRLTCTNGSKDRAAGKIDSVTKSTLKVTWEGSLGQETYTRAEGGKLPTGLPTPSPGS